MKFNAFYVVLVCNTIALGILFGTWWVNGQDDTWVYLACALIVLTSFLYVSPDKNK